MQQNQQRFRVSYFYNGNHIERADRFFDGWLDYPTKVKMDENGQISKIQKRYFPYTLESVEMGDEIEAVLRKVLRNDSENYLYRHYTNNIYGIDGNVKGHYAKPGEFSFTDESGETGRVSDSADNTVTFTITDMAHPVYSRQGSMVSNFTEPQVIYERTFSASEYVPMGNYAPNFWMVWLDYSDECFVEGKRIDGENTGVLSSIYFAFSANNPLNVFTLDAKDIKFIPARQNEFSMA